MLVKKKDVRKILITFLFSHLFIWTLIPSISNINLPLDTIEALAWGSNLDWGFSKHPPSSAFFVEIFFRIFGNQDWAYYFLSQVFVISAFFIIFKFSEDFFKDKTLCLISILLLEGISYYNFTTPEFNVYVCQFPFFALTVYFCWKSFKDNETINWVLLGLFASIGFLSHYLFIYLLIAISIFFIILIIKKKKFNLKYLIPILIFFIVLLPHLIWLKENNYITLTYALHRTGLEEKSFLDHLLYPLKLLGKQIGILMPFFIMLLLIISNFKVKFSFKDKKILFLSVVSIIPIILIILTSLIMGVKIRTMWMSPFYLFIGVFFLYILQKKIVLKKIKIFFSIFLVFFILSPSAYFYISVTQNDKRTDYPGKKISEIVQKKWDSNFTNKIVLVAGDEWHGGNLSYHLESRPKWDNILEKNKTSPLNDVEGGFVLIGDADILEKICAGVFFTVLGNKKTETPGVCMIGSS
tara:strand:+ start:2059 stop:3459 length:1401 start_codon:yes stop_codon:yes gene_type:complete